MIFPAEYEGMLSKFAFSGILSALKLRLEMASKINFDFQDYSSACMNVVPCAKFEHSQKRCLGCLKTPHNTPLFPLHQSDTDRGRHIGGGICSFRGRCPHKCPKFLGGIFNVGISCIQNQTYVSRRTTCDAE